jgi:hypothetical protein
MVLFRPDGKYAFVPSSFTPEMDIIDTGTYQVVARVPQASPFSPNLAVDQDEVWFTLKGFGQDSGRERRPHSVAHASVSINSLGLIDNLQIAATGLEPGKKYRLMLVGGSEPQGLVVLTAGIGGAAIAQTLGPLKHVVAPSQTANHRNRVRRLFGGIYSIACLSSRSDRRTREQQRDEIDFHVSYFSFLVSAFFFSQRFMTSISDC